MGRCRGGTLWLVIQSESDRGFQRGSKSEWPNRFLSKRTALNISKACCQIAFEREGSFYTSSRSNCYSLRTSSQESPLSQNLSPGLPCRLSHSLLLVTAPPRGHSEYFCSPGTILALFFPLARLSRPGLQLLPWGRRLWYTLPTNL